MSLSIIAAIGKNRELGAKNTLLWKLSGDLKRFKALTSGHSIIMGRKTYESIGRPLPLRTNIIITRQENYSAEGCVIVKSLEAAIKIAEEQEGAEEIFVIGGGEIYQQALPLAHRLYLTHIDAEYPEADTFFPSYSDFTKCMSSETGEENNLHWKYEVLERVNMSKKITSDVSKHFDWVIMPDVYIVSSLLLIDQLLLNINSPKSVFNNYQSLIKQVNFCSPNDDRNIIYPIIHNFKHGVELYIKMFGILDFHKYTYEHDLKKLFEYLKTNQKLDQNIKKIIDELYNKTWPILEEYYYGTYFKSKKLDKNNADKNNEAERYPEYNKNTYSIPDACKWVTLKKLSKIKKDIKKVGEYFNSAKIEIIKLKK